MAVTEKNCEQLVELYRNRWVIETSYWMLSEVKGEDVQQELWIQMVSGSLRIAGKEWVLFDE